MQDTRTQFSNIQKLKKKPVKKLESSLKNLRVADVELFITATRMKSLGKAAAFHHLSQSAASTVIQRVEAALGISLCTHEKRQFRLTKEGQIYLPRLENWIRELHNFFLLKGQIPIRLVTTHAIAQITIPALLSMDNIDFAYMRPDHAHAAILQDEADIALVLDNAPWKGVTTIEVGQGRFQLYSQEPATPIQPILLPEDQMEVLALQESWQQTHGYPIPVKSRIPSWSLIAHICAASKEVGFLPDFLGKTFRLYPVSWQPASSQYKILAIFRKNNNQLKERIDQLVEQLRRVFT
jgi:DNA-binding transcriptional LysR family regulator